PNHLSRGDIFLNTTNCDNTPVSEMEAMACGLPVVSTNVGGIPYLVEDGESALLTPPADAEAMSNAVVRLMHEPILARCLGWNGGRERQTVMRRGGKVGARRPRSGWEAAGGSVDGKRAPLQIYDVNRGHEPTPNPSEGGESMSGRACRVPPGRGQGGRFMGSEHLSKFLT